MHLLTYPSGQVSPKIFQLSFDSKKCLTYCQQQDTLMQRMEQRETVLTLHQQLGGKQVGSAIAQCNYIPLARHSFQIKQSKVNEGFQ